MTRQDQALYAYYKKLREEVYAPVPRDRTAERTRCDSTIPGYREAREAG